jgi:hypothetical protein
MKKLSVWLYQVSNGWVALAALVVFLTFTALVLPAQSAQAEAISGEAGSPDMSFFYAPQSLYQMADAYGEQGRSAYIQARFTFDLIWPVVYTLFLSTAISWVYARVFAPESRWRWANLAPILGMSFDYLENLATSLVMYRYPVSSDLIAWLAPFFTAIKWIFVNGSFGLLLLGGAVAIWRLARKSKSV